MVAIGEPVLEDFLFGGAEFESDISFDSGNAFFDEAVLIAADESIAKWLRIGDGLDAQGLRNARGARAEVGFFDAFDLEKLERDDGKKHVHIHVRDDGFWRDGGMSREIFGAEQAFLFGGDKQKEDGALEFFRMRFQAGGDVQDEGAAGAVVHGAVVNAVAIDGSADADVVDVRREDDEFIFQSRVAAGEFGDEVGGFDGGGLNDGVGLERNGQRKMRKGLAVFAESSDFGEAMAGACEKQFSRGGIEGYAELKAGSFVEFGVGKIHGGVIAVNGYARPGNVHGRGIGDGNGADGAGRLEGLPTFAGGLIVGGKRGGDVSGRASEIDYDFSFEVEAGKFIEIFFRNFEAVADENQGRGEIDGFTRGTSADESVVSEGEGFYLSVGGETERGLVFVDLKLIEVDRLVEAANAGRFEAGFLELVDGVSLGFAKTFAAGVTAFERIVGKKFDVGPPGVAVEVGSRCGLLGKRNAGQCEEENQRQSLTHEIHLGSELRG